MDANDIKLELRRRNMSQRDLAEAVGMSEDRLSKSLAGRRMFRLDEMDAIRAELAPADTRNRIPTIPLLGKVPAGKPQEAIEYLIRHISAPDPDTPPNAYALVVSGNSMNLVVNDGTILIIDPDDKSLWPGRRYVVETEADHKATFKEFQADPARLVPLSSDDEHKDILLGSEPIVILGRVIGYHLRDADLPRRSA
jgi:SOS-response transcriptional repressor LexA